MQCEFHNSCGTPTPLAIHIPKRFLRPGIALLGGLLIPDTARGFEVPPNAIAIGKAIRHVTLRVRESPFLRLLLKSPQNCPDNHPCHCSY